jgi:DNA-binding LacI/PurR family transcriptional regulator
MLLPIYITTVGTDIEKMISVCIEQLMRRIDNFDIPLFVQSIDTFLVIKE